MPYLANIRQRDFSSNKCAFATKSKFNTSFVSFRLLKLCMIFTLKTVIAHSFVS